jgi:type I restriction enzyme M protein
MRKLQRGSGITSRKKRTPPQGPSLFAAVPDVLETRHLPTTPPAWADLQPAPTVIPVMAEIRAHIAGNARGITRDDTIVREMVKLLHAKTFDEQQLQKGKPGRFYFLQGDSPAAVKERVVYLLDASRSSAPKIGTASDPWAGHQELILDEGSVAFAVARLQRLSVLSAERDVLGEAFESLIGPSLRGAEGQFFTPRNLVQMCVEMIAPRGDERVLDPACGAGGFLGEAMRRLNGTGRRTLAKGAIVGIDKDAFLATLCSDHLALYQRPHSVFCDNSLERPSSWSETLQVAAPLGSFDVVLTNPPFGAAIPVKGSELLGQYALARKWKKSSREGGWQQTDRLVESRPPQVLFIERCLQFLRPGGRAAIVLPEGIFGNESEGYVRHWVCENADLLAIVDCPLETFLPSTPTKTCVLFLRKKDPRKPTRDHRVFLAIAEHCGHDRRGKPLYNSDNTRRDDFPLIAAAFRAGPEAKP